MVERDFEYKELFNSEMDDLSYPEKIIYERICQKIIENSGIQSTNKLPEIFQRTITDVVSGKSANKVSVLYRKAILESYNFGYAPVATLAYFYVPEPNSNYSKQFTFNLINELSNSSITLSVPFISATSRFYLNSENVSFLSLAVLSEKKKEINYNINRDIVFYAEVSGFNVEFENSSMFFKLIKEALSELSGIPEVKTYYSGADNATLLAYYLLGSKYKGTLDLKQLNKESTSFFALLSAPSISGFLIQFPEELETKVKEVCLKWRIRTIEIGEVIGNEPNELSFGNNEKIRIDSNVPDSLILSLAKSTNTSQSNKIDGLDLLPDENQLIRDAASRLITRSNVASKRWFKYQLERFSGGNNLSSNFHTDTPLVLMNNGQIVNFAIQCIPHFFQKNAELGLQRSLLSILRRISATGSNPLSCDICFLVPESFHSFGYLKELVAKISARFQLNCIASFNILPGFKLNGLSWLPIISITGLIEKEADLREYGFKQKGDMVFLLGETKNSFCEEYMNEMLEKTECIASNFDFDEECKLNAQVKELIKNQLIKTAHAVSNNGLFTSLVEACIPGRFGVDITTDSELRNDVFLFGSLGGRFIVSVAPNKEDRFLDYLVKNQVRFTTLGHVTKEELRIDDISYGFISDIRKKYLKSLGERFK